MEKVKGKNILKILIFFSLSPIIGTSHKQKPKNQKTKKPKNQKTKKPKNQKTKKPKNQNQKTKK
jgi:hypothetical protein